MTILPFEISFEINMMIRITIIVIRITIIVIIIINSNMSLITSNIFL